MSLQRRQWYENFIKVDKQLDESKLLLESEKGSEAWIIEQLTNHFNNMNPPPDPMPTAEEIANMAQSIIAFLGMLENAGYGNVDHLMLQMLAKYLANITGQIPTPEELKPWFVPTLTNPNDVKPPPNPYIPPTIVPHNNPGPAGPTTFPKF